MDQIEIGVRGWNLFFACLVEDLPTSFSVALSHLWFCWFGLVKNEILLQPNSKDRERESHPCVNLHRERLLQFRQLIGTNLRLPKMHRIPPDVDFESSRSPAKSES